MAKFVMQSRKLLDTGKMPGHPNVVKLCVIYDASRNSYYFKKSDTDRIYVSEMTARAMESDVAGTFTLLQHDINPPAVSFYFSDDQAACLFKLGF